MSVVQINGDNVPHALEEALIILPTYGHHEDSRNGRVLTIGDPVMLEIKRPWERVVLDPRRNANPFFHLAEFVWMMSGSNDVRFIERFNKRMREYADSGSDIHHGAYGNRWRRHFGRDQIIDVSRMLRADKTTRRAVLGMWDPSGDLDAHNDIPCNTQIYFRVIDNRLNMTICNRSNDMLWGCLGANAVHMTMLHELVSRASGIEQGLYRVMSNNMHVYVDRSDWLRLKDTIKIRDDYTGQNPMRTMPLIQKQDEIHSFLADCEDYVDGSTDMRTLWMRMVFLPAMKNFQARKTVAHIHAQDWERACAEWLDRKWPSRQLELDLRVS